MNFTNQTSFYEAMNMAMQGYPGFQYGPGTTLASQGPIDTKVNYSNITSTLFIPGEMSPIPECNKLNVNAMEYKPITYENLNMNNYNTQVKKIINDIKITSKLNIGYLKVTNQILEMIDSKINDQTFIVYAVYDLVKYLHDAAKTKYFGKLIRHSVNYLQNNKIYMTIDVNTEMGEPIIYMKFNENTNFLIDFLMNNKNVKINQKLQDIVSHQQKFNQFYITFPEAQELVNTLSDVVVEDNYLTPQIYEMHEMFSKLIECKYTFEKNHINELNNINYKLLCILQSL